MLVIVLDLCVMLLNYQILLLFENHFMFLIYLVKVFPGFQQSNHNPSRYMSEVCLVTTSLNFQFHNFQHPRKPYNLIPFFKSYFH